MRRSLAVVVAAISTFTWVGASRAASVGALTAGAAPVSSSALLYYADSRYGDNSAASTSAPEIRAGQVAGTAQASAQFAWADPTFEGANSESFQLQYDAATHTFTYSLSPGYNPNGDAPTTVTVALDGASGPDSLYIEGRSVTNDVDTFNEVRLDFLTLNGDSLTIPDGNIPRPGHEDGAYAGGDSYTNVDGTSFFKIAGLGGHSFTLAGRLLLGYDTNFTADQPGFTFLAADAVQGSTVPLPKSAYAAIPLLAGVAVLRARRAKIAV